MGGEAAVSATVANQLAALGVTVNRVAGADRVATSRMLNAAAYPGAAPRALVATAWNFPDALAGGVLAAKGSMPLFTQNPECMSGAVKAYFGARSTTRVTLLGGPSALLDAVLRSERC